MNIPEKDFGISQEDLFHIWTAGFLFGIMHNWLPSPDDPLYKEKMTEYEGSFRLLEDVNAFRIKLGIDARKLSREDNETLSVWFGMQLAQRSK